MKFLFVSDHAGSLSLAMRVQREGNEVEFFISEPGSKRCGDGLINKVKDWRAALSKDKILVFDMVGQGALADKLRKQGYMVFGASALADKLELNRSFGTESMQVAGIQTPTTTTFTSFDDAVKFMATKRGRYVFKPSGNMETAYTYVAYNDEDMVNFLVNCKTDPAMAGRISFELQEYVEGVEMSLEGLFNGTNWVEGWWNITFERKRRLGGDLGSQTGCSMDVVRVLPEQIESPMVRKTLAKITPMLQASGYKGVININCIWKDGHPLGIEWTTRFGLNAIYTMLELVKDDAGKIIADVCFGSNRPIRTEKGQFGASVRCYVPEESKIKRRLVQNIANFKHIHPMDVLVTDNGEMITADTDGVIAIVTAYGSTIQKASDFVYHLIDKTDKFGILDLGYRTDCGEHAQEMYSKICGWQLVKAELPFRSVASDRADGAPPESDLLSRPFGSEGNGEAHLAYGGYDVTVTGDAENAVEV
jgi:phosphoribosylamine--glycine ligase